MAPGRGDLSCLAKAEKGNAMISRAEAKHGEDRCRVATQRIIIELHRRAMDWQGMETQRGATQRRGKARHRAATQRLGNAR